MASIFKTNTNAYFPNFPYRLRSRVSYEYNMGLHGVGYDTGKCLTTSIEL